MPFAKNVEGVSQNLVVFEFRPSPVRCQLFNLESPAFLQVLAQSIHCFAKDAIRLAFFHLKRTDLVHEVVDHVAQVHRVQHSEAEINGELQPGLSGLGLNSVAVFEQQHAEPVETSILQREAIFRLIHAESARAAGTRCEEHVVIENVLA
jgi:hypothetical protein